MNLQRIITITVSSEPLEVKNEKDILTVASVGFDIPAEKEGEAILISIDAAKSILKSKYIHGETKDRGLN